MLLTDWDSNPSGPRWPEWSYISKPWWLHVTLTSTKGSSWGNVCYQCQTHTNPFLEWTKHQGRNSHGKEKSSVWVNIIYLTNMVLALSCTLHRKSYYMGARHRFWGGGAYHAEVLGNGHHRACLDPCNKKWSDERFIWVTITCFLKVTKGGSNIENHHPKPTRLHLQTLRTLACLADAFDEHMSIVRYADQEEFDLCHFNAFLAKPLEHWLGKGIINRNRFIIWLGIFQIEPAYI